jgi:hypothetical protein
MIPCFTSGDKVLMLKLSTPEPPIRPMSSKYTAFRCPEDLLRKAKLRAKCDRRSLSNYLITLIDRDVAGMDESESESVPSSGALSEAASAE